MRLEIPDVFSHIDLSIDSPALRSKPPPPLQNARLSAGGDNLLSTHGVRKANFRGYISSKHRAHVREFRTAWSQSSPFKEISRRVCMSSRMHVRHPIIRHVVKRPVVRRGPLYIEVFGVFPVGPRAFPAARIPAFPCIPFQYFPTVASDNPNRCDAMFLIAPCLFSAIQVSFLRNVASASSAFHSPTRSFGFWYTLHASLFFSRVGSGAHIPPMSPPWPLFSGQAGLLPPALLPRGRRRAVRRSPERDGLPARPTAVTHFFNTRWGWCPPWKYIRLHFRLVSNLKHIYCAACITCILIPPYRALRA